MTTEEVLALLADRGLTVILENGQPRVKGWPQELTPKLIRVLQLHREEIIQRLTPPEIMGPPAPTALQLALAGPTLLSYPEDGRDVECLWDDGDVRLYPAPDEVNGWPFCPLAWRYAGDREWQRLREQQVEDR